MTRTDRSPTGPAATAASQGGFSLMEVMIATLLLFLVMGIAAGLLDGGNKLLRSSGISADGEVAANRIAQQIADRLIQGDIATLQDGAGAAFADGATVTNGVRVRVVVDYKGAAVLGKSYGVFIAPDGESLVADEKDNDKDNLVDEQAIFVGEWPAAPVGTIQSASVIGSRCGGLYTDPRTSRLYNSGGTAMRVPPLSITRAGRRLAITVNVLRVDPGQKMLDGRPYIRRFVGTAFVTLKN